MQIDAISPNFHLTPISSGIRSGEGAAMPLPGIGAEASSETAPAQSFGQFLQKAISEVNEAQVRAGELSTRFAAGEPLDVHQVMIAGQEADVMLQMAIQVRNKLVDAYQELMRVSV